MSEKIHVILTHQYIPDWCDMTAVIALVKLNCSEDAFIQKRNEFESLFKERRSELIKELLCQNSLNEDSEAEQFTKAEVTWLEQQGCITILPYEQSMRLFSKPDHWSSELCDDIDNRGGMEMYYGW